jgi:hypothetical protein
MSTFKKSSDVNSSTIERYFSTSVSNVPQDVEDIDALTGSWQRSQRPQKTFEELDQEMVWKLRRQFAGKIWRTNKLEQEVAYYQKQLIELKQSIQYDAEHLDKEIVDHGIHIAVDTDQIRKAPELVDRWIKEAAALGEVETEGQRAKLDNAATTTTIPADKTQ